MPCSIEGCDKPVKGLGWCSMHLSRWERHGDPLMVTRVQTPDGVVASFYENVVLPYQGAECLIWPFARHKSGYARMWHDGENRYVHRRLCEDVNGPPPNSDDEAAHSCGNGMLGCVAGNHLGWKTRLQNEAEKLAHGTVARGERQGLSVLKEPDVREIRRLNPQTPAERKAVADRYGVSASTIEDVVEKRTWAWFT